MAVGEPAAVHPVFVFDMADDLFDGGAPFHRAFDLVRDAALLAGGEDLKFVGERDVVAFVSGIGQDALDAGAGQGLDIREHGLKCVPVIGLSGQRLGVNGELAALTAVQRGGDGGLDAELIGLVGLAFADAFDLRRVQGLDMLAAAAWPLGQDPVGFVELGGKLVLQEAVAGFFADNVADGAAEIGSQRAQLGFGAVELLGVG